MNTSFISAFCGSVSRFCGNANTILEDCEVLMHDQSQQLRDSCWEGVSCLNFSVVLLWTQGSYTAVLCPHVQPQVMGSLLSWMNFPCHTLKEKKKQPKNQKLAHHSVKHRPSSIELVFRASAESFTCECSGTKMLVSSKLRWRRWVALFVDGPFWAKVK